MKTTGDRRVRKDARYRVPSLERALLILEHLDRHPDGRSMIEICQALRLPKNSVFRITLTLLDQDYLDRDPETKRLALSRKVLALGYGALGENHSIVERSLDIMRDLRNVVKETVCISVLLGGEGFVLEQAPGLHPFRFEAAPGTRQPLHASASCKAILACLPERELGAILRKMTMPRLTPRTITRKRAFRRELGNIRTCGYALDRAEQLEGVVCVSAPILDRRGYPAASITVTGPTSRMPKGDLASVGAQVRAHADRISARLGNGPGAEEKGALR